MTAPVGYEENGGTTCGSPRTGSADASEATNAGRAAAAPRALVPNYRFHQRIARRSLYGFKMAVPAPAPKKFLWGRAGMGEGLPFMVRRHPMRPPPTRGDLERKCWRSWEGTGSASVTRRHAVPLPTTGECEGRESGQERCKSLAETRAPTAIPYVSGAFRSITRSLAYFAKSRRKWAVPRRHHALVCVCVALSTMCSVCR